jgi:hypothetical protein
MIFITQITLKGSKRSAIVRRTSDGIRILYNDETTELPIHRDDVEGILNDLCKSLDGNKDSYAFRNAVMQLVIQEGE